MIEATVAFVTAPLGRHIVRGRNSRTYFADVGPVHKGVKVAVYDALPEGLSCHLYYAPGARSLLSIEPATAGEPTPAHPFGPDAAHVWDRLRWSWVLITTAVLAVLIGSHMVMTAHPAQPYSVSGTVANYVETHGKSTTRSLYLAGESDSYTPERESAYTPPVPGWQSLVGQQVRLYVNQGTRNVLAITAGDRLHG